MDKNERNILGNVLEIDEKIININDYLLSNLEEEIKSKVDELVNMIICSKYGSITFYYDNLFNQVLNEYKFNDVIDKDKIKFCVEIMNNYYNGVIGIDNFFNV